jgi:hypothetical protein
LLFCKMRIEVMFRYLGPAYWRCNHVHSRWRWAVSLTLRPPDPL